MTIERVRGAAARAEVVQLLSAREPDATWALAVLLRPAPERHSKVWLLRRDGAVAGVLVSARYCFDRWSGILLLDDTSCAAEMARALDRSNVWSVVGPASGLEAVLPLTKRGRALRTTWFYAVPHAAAVPRAPDGGPGGALDRPDLVVRPATPADLGALVSLNRLDNEFGVSAWRLRSAARRALPRTLVAESSDGVVGAVMTAPTTRYAVISRLVVAPALRSTRIAGALALQASLAAIAQGRGFCGFKRTPDASRILANALHMSREQLNDVSQATRWGGALLWPPRRFRGHTRLRIVVERLENAVSRRAGGERR